MAVRQQQRRGTAAQWTSANPILSAAEIGVEIDTSKFKIGDGTNRWADLTYFTTDAATAVTAEVQTAINNLIGGAPGILDTLKELADSIGNDGNFVGTITSDLAAKAPLASPTFTGTVSGVTKSMVGLGNVDNTSDANKPVSTATQTALDLKANTADITELSQDAVNSALTAGSGITKTYNDSANTITVAVDSTIATKTYADGKASDAQTAAAADATTKANNAKSGAETTAATALASHEADTTNIHGIADTSALATKTYADNAASNAVSGLLNNAPAAFDTLKEIADALTADESAAATLATLVGTKAPIASPTFTGTVSGITKSMVGLGNVDNTTDTAKPVSTAQQTALDLKANIASPTFTGTVSGISKSMVGLGSVDNTSDVNKPVSTATQTALDLEVTNRNSAITSAINTEVTNRNSAIATAKSQAISTSEGYTDTAIANLVNSAPSTLDTLKELADALTADESTATTLATTVGTKAPSANPTFTGTVVLPSTTSIGNVSATEIGYVDGVTSSIQTQLDSKAPTASPTFTGTVSGITKSMVGLTNVDNTSDANKPVSSATQTALDAKLSTSVATSTYETISNVSLKAPLLSPTFTGTPLAPTASSTTNNTQIATTAFVKSQITNISDFNLVLDGGGV